MKKNILLILLFFSGLTTKTIAQDSKLPTISAKTATMNQQNGFFPFYWEEKEGKVWLEVGNIGEEFLYVNSLTGGIGSNDIGLDRNQLGGEQVVYFYRSGSKLLLVQPNLRYRAVSDNPEEAKSVEEAFAKSVLWGFKIEAEEKDKVLIDLTPFLLRDAHGVAGRLKTAKQGSYKPDSSRSAIYMERTKNFPKNTEFDAMVTFTGDPEGQYIRSVTPDPEAVTVRMHHSLIELPDDKYAPRVFDPRSGYYPLSYQDYATPIDQPLVKRLITRHRLQKKDPTAKRSEPVEPIIYYLDRGAPEPVKSALIEGASWWNQAFEAAGYKNAFQVKELPEGADPMDVRYNVINWVHRSTRGWSYGGSVTDPRTGEIIKGHVLLGSLRVRQDFMIAQGLIAAYENGLEPQPELLEMALARLRQLSAHEVGHTLGLAHNFAASYNERASVMDYPHPYVTMDQYGRMDFTNAYDNGIGAWDKRTILYGYQDFPDKMDEAQALADILENNNERGLFYISDSDARPSYGAHPSGHLWDNGTSAVEELERLTKVREKALSNFGADNIPKGQPMATLENVLVPLYLAHRYQVEAVSKLIGGVNYSYAVRGDDQVVTEVVEDNVQRSALEALLNTLNPSFLEIPEEISQLIPPQPIGYSRNRELFKVHTGLTFDPIGAAESSANHSINFLLDPARLARLVEQSSREVNRLSPYEVMDQLLGSIQVKKEDSPFQQELSRMTEKLVIHRILELAGDPNVMRQVSALALLKIEELEKVMEQKASFTQEPAQRAHYIYLLEQIRQFRKQPGQYKVPKAPAMPDGSPIGCY